MCDPISATIGILGAVGTGMQYKAMNDQKNAMEKSMAEQKAMAEQQLKAQQTEVDSVAQKTRRASSAEMLYGPKKGGSGSTSLTGPMGVDLSSLSLGKNTLLGS